MGAGPSDDTSEEAARVQLDLIRRASPTRRIEACLGLSRSLIALSRAALRKRRPEAQEQEIMLEWAEINYGVALGARLRSYLASRR